MAHKKAFIKRYLEESDEACSSKQQRLAEPVVERLDEPAVERLDQPAVEMLEGSGYDLRNRVEIPEVAAPNEPVEPFSPEPIAFDVARRRGRREATLDRFTPRGPAVDYGIFLHDVQEPIRPLLAEEVRRQNGVKFHLIADIRFRKSTDPNEIQEWDIVSRAIRLLPIDNIDGALEGICSDVSRKIEEYIERGTGWVVDQLNFIDLYINRYRPLRGNSYFPTPKQLAAKKAILNIKNKDQKCFLWCVLAHLHPVDHVVNVLVIR